MLITASVDFDISIDRYAKKTEQNLFVCAGKFEATVTNNKRHSR